MDCALDLDCHMTRSKTILVVDDEPALMAALDCVLAEDGHEVTGTCHAADAIDLARELLPDLILSDIRMPGMSPPVLLRALRQDPTTAEIPVVFFTSWRTSDEPPSAGYEEAIPHPIPRAELPERVRRGIALGIPPCSF
jgi:CheY-like chemotaxis protein